MFSVHLCHLQLKSFCDFIVVCNVTWQYFKDIIIIYFWVFCMVYYCHLGGSFNSYSLEEFFFKKINHSVDAETYRPGESPISPCSEYYVAYHNVTTYKRYLAGFTRNISCFLAFEKLWSVS